MRSSGNTFNDNPINSLSQVTVRSLPNSSILYSIYYLLDFFVPLKKRLVNSLALPELTKDSYLEPPFKNKETETVSPSYLSEITLT